MVHAPYPARIAAGLVVTAIEETRKLPALVVTLPMTAVSQTLQAGMRLQQNFAELAIKGDLALETLFEKPAEQPEWARFDDDDDAIDAEADRTPIESRGESPAVTDDTTAGADAPAPAKAPAKKTAAKKAPAQRTPPKKTNNTGPTPTTDEKPAEPSSGRFALYSAPPEDLVTRDTADGSASTGVAAYDGPVPEIVEYIEYDNLTLAQLRAKLRTVGLDELEQLVAYEKSTKARAPFITMIDNRITSQNSKRQPTT
ncbi:lipid droplet-associated protein [Gordonia insulae]|uniref:Lipid droplet-associated protein n=1 Tax=Gordonia insulae TaxID=2420509 RepID=A0A3G8JKE6_9ACTN|nr:lipid droplet-associated protein [Gordonia insulae]AZG44969.1 hypothetical protein D7316_01561 [Gordonia insulae]